MGTKCDVIINYDKRLELNSLLEQFLHYPTWEDMPTMDLEASSIEHFWDSAAIIASNSASSNDRRTLVGY